MYHDSHGVVAEIGHGNKLLAPVGVVLPPRVLDHKVAPALRVSSPPHNVHEVVIGVFLRVKCHLAHILVYQRFIGHVSKKLPLLSFFDNSESFNFVLQILHLINSTPK